MIRPEFGDSDRRLAILASGGGTTAQEVIEASYRGSLEGINPVLLVSSRRDADCIRRAEALEVPTAVLPRRDYDDTERFGADLLLVLQQHDAQIVSQNGWLAHTPSSVIDVFHGAIINQHPGPLQPGFPDFGGTGMYGKRVHAARIAYYLEVAAHGIFEPDEFWTEATVHHVDDEYDRGPVIRVARLCLSEVIGTEALAQLSANRELLMMAAQRAQERLLPLEHDLVKAVLHDFVTGQVPTFIREGRIVPDQNVTYLDSAKQLAISLFPHG